MNFLPIMIMNAILLVITILLSIADRFLVNYGACKITVTQEDEKKEFVVEGGGYLHAALIENDFRLTTSCGGKATCGYCKVNVLNGGGPILPTEEIFMSRKEKAFGIRLACQVKVKEDIEIFIPDFLTIVRNMVENRTYDSKLRWRFIKGDPGERISEKETMKLSHEDNLELQGIIEDCKDMEGALVPILQKVNHRFNYLPEPVGDSIFAIIGEELGFIGVVSVITLFVILAYCGIRICLRAPDLFGSYLALGITSLIVLHAVINLGVVLGLLPTKGSTLPFISYGGTSLVVNFISIGILLNISSQLSMKRRL